MHKCFSGRMARCEHPSCATLSVAESLERIAVAVEGAAHGVQPGLNPGVAPVASGSIPPPSAIQLKDVRIDTYHPTVSGGYHMTVCHMPTGTVTSGEGQDAVALKQRLFAEVMRAIREEGAVHGAQPASNTGVG